jgi:alanyl-tRNA synthetase
MNSAAISQRFTEYYEARGFHLLPRAPMLDASIPMSFVMSAGLVQIETSLAGMSNRPGNQFVLVQNCFRHFDLGTVGKDSTHLSFFEMPGAFTFGPNNKAETIQHMWFLATSVLGINRERIWATYFKGGTILQNNLPEDILTRQTWLELGLPEEQVVGLETNNFWIQGRGIENLSTPRKCGPNTELFFDRGVEKACGPDCKPGCGCERFVEFSNSLFISYVMDERNRELRPISEPFTETVIGTERVAMILQAVSTVFEIDRYRPLIERIRGFSQKTDLPVGTRLSSERVIADYIKALYCLIADGAPPPGKNGRERIIKQLIRGVLTHREILGISASDFLPALLGCVADSVSVGSDETVTRERVLQYFRLESRRFSQTLERGKHVLDQLLAENPDKTLSGAQIADLEKQHGFPHSLAAAFLRQRGLPFLEADYRQALRVWKQTVLN